MNARDVLRQELTDDEDLGLNAEQVESAIDGILFALHGAAHPADESGSIVITDHNEVRSAAGTWEALYNPASVFEARWITCRCGKTLPDPQVAP